MSESDMVARSDVGRGSTPGIEALLTASPYLFCALDRDGAIRRANAAAEAIFGYSEDELTGHNLLSLVHPDDRPRISKAVSDAREAAEGPLLLRAEASAGHLRALSIWFSRDPESRLILGWGRDVTESRAIREELRMRIELLEDRLARRTRAVAELQTRLEDLRRYPIEAPPEEPRGASRPASPRISGTVRSRRNPSSRKKTGNSWLRSGPPPRMTMGRYDPTPSPLPESSSNPGPRPQMRPPR